MSRAYIREHAEQCLLRLDIAKREARHLDYTVTTLLAQPIDLAWVQSLNEREDRAEKLDALVARFGRLQDYLGDQVLPMFMRLLGGQGRHLLEVLSFAEKMRWVTNADDFIAARQLRNRLVHEYMNDPALFLEAILAIRPASRLLLGIVERLQQEAKELGLAI